MQTFKTVVIAAIFGALAGGAVVYVTNKPAMPTAQESIAEFYRIENAVHVSPHSLRGKMDKGDKGFVLVDLRSPQEYQREHIIGAVNIAAYTDPNTSAYDEKDRITAGFRALPEGKEVIVYCYSMPCMTGRKVGQMLAEQGIFVKHLGIGWNEWRHFWTLWNHEHEWASTAPEMYIATGTDPGVPLQRELPSPCGEGEFAC